MDNRLSKRNKTIDIVCTVPVFLFIWSITIVRVYWYKMPLSEYFFTSATDTKQLSEMYSYWKSFAIIAAAVLAIIVGVLYYCQEWLFLKKSFLYIPLFVYALFVLLSLAFSEYKYFAIHGTNYYFGGTFVLLSYCVMVLYLYNAVDSIRRVKLVVYFTLGVSALLGALGVSQVLGHNFLLTTVGQKLIAPNVKLTSGELYWDKIDRLAEDGETVFHFTHGISQTIGNMDHLPLYISLLLPVSAFLFIYFAYEKKRRSIVFLLLYGLLLFNFFASRAASGYFGLVAMFLAALVFFGKYIKQWGKPIICLVLITALVMGVSWDDWYPEVRSLFPSVASHMVTNVYAEGASAEQMQFENEPGSKFGKIDYIETDGLTLSFSVKGNVLNIVRNKAAHVYELYDTEWQPLSVRTIKGAKNKYEILDDRYHDFFLLTLPQSEEESGTIVVSMKRYDWKFRYDGKTFYFKNPVGKEVVLHPVEHAGLIPNGFGSGRGYFYDTSIPLLKNYVFIGVGADCFPFAFPQADYVTYYNRRAKPRMNIVVDRPHDLYLQYWINTGAVSLFAWLTLVGYYLVGAVRSLRKNRMESFSDFVNGGIFCGILAFLAVALFNDGLVYTMPMFYTMLGTGLAINATDKWIPTKKAAKKAK